METDGELREEIINLFNLDAEDAMGYLDLLDKILDGAREAYYNLPSSDSVRFLPELSVWFTTYFGSKGYTPRLENKEGEE